MYGYVLRCLVGPVTDMRTASAKIEYMDVLDKAFKGLSRLDVRPLQTWKNILEINSNEKDDSEGDKLRCYINKVHLVVLSGRGSLLCKPENNEERCKTFTRIGLIVWSYGDSPIRPENDLRDVEKQEFIII